MRRRVFQVACFCGFVDRSERAVRSAAVRNRYRELVRRAIPWAPVGEWRNLRPGEVDRRAPDASLGTRVRVRRLDRDGSIDLSHAAAARLGMMGGGVAPVTLEVVETPTVGQH
jgi:hypothetical protein